MTVFSPFLYFVLTLKFFCFLRALRLSVLFKPF